MINICLRKCRILSFRLIKNLGYAFKFRHRCGDSASKLNTSRSIIRLIYCTFIKLVSTIQDLVKQVVTRPCSV